MAKNNFSYPGFPNQDQENIIINDYECHSIIPSTTMQDFPANVSFQFQGCPSTNWPPEDASSSKSHRQAEKRRRDRINAQFASLRNFIPKSEKMDKAALLERVVEELKDLKRKASEISKILSIPTQIDEVKIDEYQTNIQDKGLFQICNEKHNKNMLIKATFCCEDRPELVAELIRALKSLNLTTVGADIACLGGRMKSILILCNNNDHIGDNNNNNNNNDKKDSIKESLMAVLSRIVSWSTTTPNFRVTSKRQRFFFSP